MKLAFATALMASTAAAFSPASVPSASTALKMSAVETELYTFEKSEEIFTAAKEVSFARRKGEGKLFVTTSYGGYIIYALIPIENVKIWRRGYERKF